MRRSVGLSAADGGSAASLAVTQDFYLPATCVPVPGTAALLLPGCCLLLALERRRMPSVHES